MNRRFRSDRPFRGRRRGGQLIGVIWLFGLAFLAFSNRWWPGILILVGITMILSMVLNRVDLPDRPDLPPQPAPPPQPADAPTPFAAPANEPMRTQTPQRAAPIELPDRCPNCGGPTGAASAQSLQHDPTICQYCGSRLVKRA